MSGVGARSERRERSILRRLDDRSSGYLALAFLASLGCGAGNLDGGSSDSPGSLASSDAGEASSNASVSPSIEASVTYPFLLTVPNGSVEYFPTMFAHLLGQSIAWTDISTSLACVTLTSATDVPTSAEVRVALSGYSTPLEESVVVPAHGTTERCMSPTPSLAALYDLDAPIPGQVHTTVTLDGATTPILDDVHAITIATGQTAFDSKRTDAGTDLLFKYQAVLAMPKDPAVQALLAPIAARSAWGTFGAGGYGMHLDADKTPIPRLPVTTTVPSGGYQVDPVYFLADESIALTVDGVACSACTGQDIGFYALNQAEFDAFTSSPAAGIPEALVRVPAAIGGAQVSIAPSVPGQYYLVFVNAASDASPRTLTYHRTGTQADTVIDAMQAAYDELQSRHIQYVNVAFSFFDPTSTETVRWPAASLTDQAANCMDGSVLFASIFEALQLEPVVVIVTGHAFVGVREAAGSSVVWPLETTLLGTAPFLNALVEGIAEYNSPAVARVAEIDIKAARLAGVTPIPE
jgi:hypothetical protein